MTEQSSPTGSRGELFRGRWLVIAASFVVVIAGLRAASSLLLPLLLATFLALLSYPAVEWLVRRRVRPSIAVGAVVLAEVGLLAVLGFLISGALNDFAQAAPGYVQLLIDKAKVAIDALRVRGVDLSDVFALERIDPSSLVDFAGGIVGETVKGVASVLSVVSLVLIVLVCVLIEAPGLPAKLRAALGSRGATPHYLTGVTKDVQKYLGVKTLISAITGIAIGLWLWILGVPFPLVWGLIAFLLNYIPAVGSMIAAVPTCLVTLLQDGLGLMALVALGYVVVNLVLGNIIEPRMMGRRFGLSTLVVFLSLFFWGWIWGPIGMLLSVPLTMVIKIVLAESPDMRWLAVLLGPVPAETGKDSA